MFLHNYYNSFRTSSKQINLGTSKSDADQIFPYFDTFDIWRTNYPPLFVNIQIGSTKTAPLLNKPYSSLWMSPKEFFFHVVIRKYLQFPPKLLKFTWILILPIAKLIWTKTYQDTTMCSVEKWFWSTSTNCETACPIRYSGCSNSISIQNWILYLISEQTSLLCNQSIGILLVSTYVCINTYFDPSN